MHYPKILVDLACKRAERALTAAHRDGAIPPHAIPSLIADLLHLASRQGETAPMTILGQAQAHFAEEAA